MSAIAALADGIGGLLAALVVIAAAAGSIGAGAAVAVVGHVVLPLVMAALLAAWARGRAGTRAASWSVGAGVAVAIGAWLLAVFADLLKAHTHHRGLAGTTFGLVGLGIAVAAVALGARLGAWTRRGSRGLEWIAVGAALGSILALAARGGLFARPMGTLEALGLGGVLAAIFGWSIQLRGARTAVGVGVAVATLGLAALALGTPEPERPVPQEEAHDPVR